MRVKFGENILNLNEIKNEEYRYSDIYNENMHIFSHIISVSGRKITEFRDILEKSKAGGIYSINENGEYIDEYKVKSNSYSYLGNKIDDKTIYNYDLSFEQVIKKEIKALKIGGLEVIPYKINQEYDGGVIINASIKLLKHDKKIFDDLEDGKRYFDVIRVGISEEPLKMRFGTNIWSEHEEYCKVNIILVEKKYDDVDRGNGLFQPQIQNIMDMLAYQRNLNKELLDLLVNKNIVDISEIDIIRKNAEDNINDSHRLFHKVDDADKF